MKYARLAEVQNKEPYIPDVFCNLRIQRILREADEIAKTLKGPIPEHSPIRSYALGVSARILREAADKLDSLR